MKVVVWRIREASITNDALNDQIRKGYCLLVGIGQNLTEQDVDVIAKKIINAGSFEDDNSKLNFNIRQMNGEILSVSQFTLYVDVKKGNRPGFSDSKNPNQTVGIYEYFNNALWVHDFTVKTGELGTRMSVSISNDGPVAITYEDQDGRIRWEE